jgi:hypothetical protein
MKIAGLGALVLFTAAAAHADDKSPRCFKEMYEGHCVAAEVNGQKTVRLSKKTKKLLKERGTSNLGNCEIRYEVPSPIRGDLDMRFAWLPEAVAYFGADAGVSVHVFPLEGQSLVTRPELSTNPSVRVGGSQVVTRADVIDSNRLPPGKYVLTARVSGSRRGWDCHKFVVEVAE